jgi:prepilin-type processing-associated H-X9-DG protein
VELIVVVAIIALLIGLLLPALSQSREAARQATCLSNLRGMQIAWTIAIDQHKGRIPSTRSVFIQPNWQKFMIEAFINLPLALQADRPLATECPSVHRSHPDITLNNARFGYPINWWWTDPGSMAHANHELCNEGKSWAAVLRPSRYPLFTDPKPRSFASGEFALPDFVPNPNTGFGSPHWGVGPNHAGGTAANASFADGGARTVPIREIHDVSAPPDSMPWFANR